MSEDLGCKTRILKLVYVMWKLPCQSCSEKLRQIKFLVFSFTAELIKIFCREILQLKLVKNVKKITIMHLLFYLE